MTILVKEGVNVNALMEDGATPFRVACQLGFPEILKSLMKAQGSDVNDFFSDGWNPLVLVSNFGFTEAVKVLVKAGAIVDTVCTTPAPDGKLSKFTAMCIACQKGHFKVNPKPQTLNPKPLTLSPEP